MSVVPDESSSTQKDQSVSYPYPYLYNPLAGGFPAFSQFAQPPQYPPLVLDPQYPYPVPFYLPHQYAPPYPVPYPPPEPDHKAPHPSYLLLGSGDADHGLGLSPGLVSRVSKLVSEADRREEKAPRKKKIEKAKHEKEKEVKVGHIVFREARGDWQCTDKKCLNWNYAKRNKCNLCKRVREGKDDAKVLREESDDDKFQGSWACRKCDFKNYPSRAVCFKCKDPKPSRGPE